MAKSKSAEEMFEEVDAALGEIGRLQEAWEKMSRKCDYKTTVEQSAEHMGRLAVQGRRLADNASGMQEFLAGGKKNADAMVKAIQAFLGDEVSVKWK